MDKGVEMITKTDKILLYIARDFQRIGKLTHEERWLITEQGLCPYFTWDSWDGNPWPKIIEGSDNRGILRVHPYSRCKRAWRTLIAFCRYVQAVGTTYK